MSRRVRVLHVIASSRGGGAVHVRELALGLDRARFDSSVAMPEDGGNVRRSEFEAAGIPFHVVDMASGFPLRALVLLRRLMHMADILHVHAARAALLGRLACRTLGHSRPRVVYTLHGFAAPYYAQPRRSLQSFTERAMASVTDRIVTVSHAEREDFVSARLAKPECVQVIQNGIDAEQFANAGGDRAAIRGALGIPAQAVLTTTICRLHKPRDFDTLLRAFQLVAVENADAHLLIVGDGPQRPLIEAQIARLALKPRVTLTSWRHDLPALYAASDIYSLTTWGWEGLPLTVLEAMAAGLPVVATNAGGIPEAVLAGQTGLLAARRDIDGLAQALRRLASDPMVRQQFGRAGRERVRQTFTRARMLTEIARTYQALVD